MTGAIMVAALWSAALYRIFLSIMTEKTVWRTAFTTCAVGAAVGATTSVYGDQTIDAWASTRNLAVLLTRLSLTIAGVAASVFMLTLKQKVVSAAAVRLRLAVGAVFLLVEVATWVVAPIHARELSTTSEVDQSSAAGCLFAVAFGVAVAAATAEMAHVCLSRARSRIDIARTVSFLLIGSACAIGAVLFALGSLGVVLSRLTDVTANAIPDLIDAAVPILAVVLASGTLSLLVVPTVVDLVRSYTRWRTLRPLWQHLVELQPGVRLDVRPTGAPLSRLHLRLQRAMVEIHDALRVTPVSVPTAAVVDDLAVALHRVGGPVMAGEVLERARTPDVDDADQLLALARCYARTRS